MKPTIVLALAFTLTAAGARAEKVWSLAHETPKIVTTDAKARPVAPSSISAGNCTVTIVQAALGAQLTFTCPETAWRVYVRNTDKGLQIRRAELRRTPTAAFMPIIFEANIAEIFVPYHDGVARLSDTQHATAKLAIRPMTAGDVAGATAELITMQGDAAPTAAVEIRDRGLVWMCKGVTKGTLSRRGQEMAVWGTWDPGNYDYIIEYSFRDDGQISFRVGATGYNNPDFAHLGHMHDVLWRIDVDLNGDKLDTAYLTQHHEDVNQLTANDTEVTFNNGLEGAAALDPYTFAALAIEDAAKNQRGRHFSYELVPFRRGVARHNEAWCRDDVWVTQFRAGEPAVPASWTSPTETLYGTAQKPWGIYDKAPIEGRDIVLWHSSPIHHEPHDEDQSPTDPGDNYRGLTLMHWTGFDLVPHNLFDANPLGAPDKSMCD